MKTVTIFAALLIAILNGLVLVPSLQDNAAYMVAGAITLALWLMFKALTFKQASPEPEPVLAPEPTTETVTEKVVDEELSKAQVIAVLGSLQSKGRLIDFLMDDVTAYNDAQVGAAARAVHQGCRSALDDHFVVEPVSKEAEGSTISVPQDAAADDYRLVGNVSGEPPFSGKLVHKGWAVRSVKLPRVVDLKDGKLPAIAPAQVELS